MLDQHLRNFNIAVFGCTVHNIIKHFPDTYCPGNDRSATVQ